MALLPETPTYEVGIYQLETVDQVLGGSGGISNIPSTQLANRTAYLKGVADNHETRVTVLENGGFQGLRNAVIQGSVTFSGSLPTRTATLGAGAIITMTNGYDATTGRENRVSIKTATALSCVCSGAGYVVLTYFGGTPALVYVQTTYLLHVTSPIATTTPTFLHYDHIDNLTVVNDGVTFTTGYACVIGRIDGSANWWPRPLRRSFYDDATPAGTIAYFHGLNTPEGGWLPLNGSSGITQTSHPNLYYQLYAGGAHGSITLPDARGEFLRGLDQGRGIDPSRLIGTAQSQEIGQHRHSVGVRTNGAIGNGQYLLTADITTGTVDTVDVNDTGAAENRPRNLAFPVWIKF